MPVTQTLTFSATPPTTGENPTTFNYKAIACWNDLKNNIVPDMNTAFSQMNTLEDNVNAKEASTVDNANSATLSALSAQGSANYQGVWTSKGYTVGQTVSDSNGVRWLCKLTHTTAQTPAEGTYWTIAVPYLGAIGNINSPLLDMPLKNSLAMKSGVGSATFTRASTATYIDRYGVLKTAAVDEPRFEKEGYLNEGSSTNLLTYSEQFTGWVFNACSQTSDATVYNPYGLLGFSKFTASGAGAWFNATTGTLTQPTPTTPITISFFVKEGTITRIRLRVTEGGTFQNDVVINIVDGTKVVEASTFNVSIEYLANGIKRIKATYTPIITHTSFGFRFYMQNNSGDSTSGDYMWFSCAQLEALPFATSYIPTTSATVTRSADVLSVTANGNIGTHSSDVTLMSDHDSIGAVSGTYPKTLFIIDSVHGTASLQILTANYGALTPYIYKTSIGSASFTANVNTKYRLAAVWNSINGWFYKNGVLVESKAYASIDNTKLNQIWIGSQYGTTHFHYGHISNIRIYDKALTAQEVALS